MKKRNTFKFCVLVLLLLLCSGCGKKEKYSVDMGDGSTRQLLLTQEAPRPELTDWELPQRDGWVFCGIYGEYRMKGGSTHDYRLYDSTLQPTKEPGWEFDRVFLKWVPETVSLNEKNLKQFLELSYEASVEMTEYNNNGLRIPGMIKAVITLSPNDDWSFIGPVCVDAEVTMHYNLIPSVSCDTVTKEVEFLLEKNNGYSQTLTVDMVDPASLTTSAYDISLGALKNVEGQLSLAGASDTLLKKAIKMGLSE